MNAVWKWIRVYGADVLLLVILLTLFFLIYVIIRGNYENKPGWLLLPITGVYVVVNVYMATGSILAARASQKSTEVMQETLQEMRLARQMQYSPWFSYPEGPRISLKEDGHAYLKMKNLFRVPVGQLYVMLWELENGPQGSTIRFSSMRESRPQDFSEGDTEFIIDMSLSSRTDEEKARVANLALSDYIERWRGQPMSSLCVIAYNIAGEAATRFLLFDFEISGRTSRQHDLVLVSQFGVANAPAQTSWFRD